MNLTSDNIGVFEQRFIGDCPWCGKEVILMRDYMCYHAIHANCHEFYRLLPNKVLIAQRAFPHGTVDTTNQFDRLAEAFYDCCRTDRRFIEKHGPHINKIEGFQADNQGNIQDFFSFLLRTFIIRGKVQIKGMNDLVKNHCLICGVKFTTPSTTEICKDCIESVCKSAENLKTQAAPPVEKHKHTGMHYNKRAVSYRR